VQVVSYGSHIMSAWYHSPLPSPFDKCKHLFVCPYTLKYFRKRRQLQKHIDSLPMPKRRPPGERVYRSPPGGRQWKVSTPEAPMLTAACDPTVRSLRASLLCAHDSDAFVIRHVHLAVIASGGA
jgi:MYST family zinc finger domain